MLRKKKPKKLRKKKPKKLRKRKPKKLSKEKPKKIRIRICDLSNDNPSNQVTIIFHSHFYSYECNLHISLGLQDLPFWTKVKCPLV